MDLSIDLYLYPYLYISLDMSIRLSIYLSIYYKHEINPLSLNRFVCTGTLFANKVCVCVCDLWVGAVCLI